MGHTLSGEAVRMVWDPGQATRLFLGALLILLLPWAFVGCSATTTTTTTTTFSASSTAGGSLGTITFSDLEVTWSPAHEPSAADKGAITDALSSRGLTMLFPSEAPVAGSTSAGFILWRSAPTNESWLNLWVRIDDEAAPLVSVSAAAGAPVEPLGGEPVDIRGTEGELLIVPGAVCFLRWQEHGQTYHVEFLQERLPIEVLLAWLEEWQTLPENSEVTSVSATSTTLPPGIMTFGTLISRFEKLVDHEDLLGTLPYSVMPAEEVAWVAEAVAPLAVTDVQGYEFANDDVVVLFFVEARFGGSGIYEKATRALDSAARDKYVAGDEGPWTHIDGDFGYVVVSAGYRSELGRLAQWARTAHQALIPGEG